MLSRSVDQVNSQGEIDQGYDNDKGQKGIYFVCIELIEVKLLFQKIQNAKQIQINLFTI